MAKTTHPDQHLIDGLVSHEATAINEIYKRCASKVKSYIVFNNGSVDDAEDIFQEVLVDIYNQAKYKHLQLTCPFEPFMLMVCKRKWLNALKKKSLLQVTNNEDDLLSVGEDTFLMAEQLEAQNEKARIFLDAFKKLGDRCQEIIKGSLQNDGQEILAQTLGVTYGYLRKKKSECMASLYKMVQAKLGNHGER